jgi:hypothetical protein
MDSKRWVVIAGALLFAGLVAVTWWIQRGAGPATVAPAVTGDRAGRVAAPDEPFSLSDPAHDIPSSDAVEGVPASARAEFSTRRDIRVRVVDAARRPLANVPVALAAVGEREQHGGLVVRTRAPDGIASFIAPDESLRREMSETDWCVYLPFPGAGRQFMRVDRADPPVEPIELVAPELGRLVVKVDDARGRRIEARGELQLFCWPAGAERSPDMRTSTFPFRFPFAESGELVIDPIAIGLALDLEVWLEQYAVVSVLGDGPRRAGETANLSALMRRYGPIVIGRLVDADGTPVARTPLTGFVVGDSGVDPRDGGVELATDAAGHFRFDASGWDVESGPRPRELVLYGAKPGAGTAGRARVAWPAVFVAGEHDVGSVTYETAPLVVSGRVVDLQGSAPAGARVHVCRSVSATNDGLRASGAGDVVCAVSDESGAFALYGFEEGEFVAFAVDAHQHESAPVHFTPVRRAMTLVLRDGGALQGSFAQDALVDMNQFGLYVRRADRDSADDGGLHARISAASDGSFRWNRLAAGVVDIVIALGRDGAHPEIVHVVPGVEVTAGAVNHPERLAQIDLRPHVTSIEIEVVDPEGAPVRSGTVTLLSADAGHEPVVATPLTAGRATVTAPKRVVDVDVRAPGFLRERRYGLTSSARVELRRAIPVRLAFDPPFELEGGGILIGLVLSAAERADAGADQQHIALDAHGSASFLSSESGRFQVELESFPTLRTADGSPQITDPDVTRSERWKAAQQRLAAAFGRPLIELAEAVGEQRLVVPLPPAARTILSDMLRDYREESK